MITIPIQTPNTGWSPGSNDRTIISRICVQASLADRWFSMNEMRTNGRTIFWRQYDLKGATTHSLVKERTSAEFSLMNNGCVSFSDLVVLSTKIDSTFPTQPAHRGKRDPVLWGLWNLYPTVGSNIGALLGPMWWPTNGKKPWIKPTANRPSGLVLLYYQTQLKY